LILISARVRAIVEGGLYGPTRTVDAELVRRISSPCRGLSAGVAGLETFPREAGSETATAAALR